MGWISSILLGALAGWLASIIMNRDAEMGALANIIVGIIGGVIGNFVAGLIGLQATSDWSIGGIAISVLGAVILLWLLDFFRSRK
ncbi:GlsB/YeaQ/YmgE family stress response membrane protein [Helcococcus massiliensis]|uniref:GlsB/YeaQ/YmgE family stress response membrane protein n=1 Tax=Helcococcus massiliensis TaxID=2040290 RepID=UPI000CDE795E|nr:GlsB/YeaQ/YmgE family stress response membrane protein [Helcococcus massiliensis]